MEIALHPNPMRFTGTIDSHVHLYPPEVNADPAGWAASAGEGRWAALCLRRRRDGTPVQAFPGVEGLLAAMDAAGVDRAVLQGWYWENPASCALQNRFYASCIRSHPDRFSAAAAIHPGAGREAALAELRRARSEGFCALGELSPHSQGYPASDPVLAAVLSEAAALGLPVTLHVTDPGGRAYPGRVETPLADFVRLAADHPGVRFVLAHWGGLLPLRLPPGTLPGNLWYDTAASPLVADPGIWRRFTAAAGAQRVLFGSDFPLNNYPGLDREPGMGRLLAEAAGSGLAPAEIRAVTGGNSAKLFCNAA